MWWITRVARWMVTLGQSLDDHIIYWCNDQIVRWHSDHMVSDFGNKPDDVHIMCTFCYESWPCNDLVEALERRSQAALRIERAAQLRRGMGS